MISYTNNGTVAQLVELKGRIMEIKELVKEISNKFNNLKSHDDFDDNDFYVDRYSAGIKLRTVDGNNFLFIHLENLPGKDTVVIQWTKSKNDYELLSDFLYDTTIIDIISLFIIASEANKGES